ncbi:hypothetical protein DICPUDRAFT_95750 [Dictyostelium purpureum]|uniref:AAA+ ATPase domain-containing protein n=1 Tax=Dictyostelium purpureum TaxID=5786 RepID=F1A0B2_DICPU|nr:uncharacterized protein DICPUDRAFT_95750 [Dictyostelium purpureum]EGC30360.1 hypothetical protein DICPUDRAFT_95750 [Dictyostelium purpureum]|eukprot:XP_003293102.1 hypothetical protein DICPUDRAFT_95750 [Dictyostelium purpureum]
MNKSIIIYLFLYFISIIFSKEADISSNYGGNDIDNNHLFGVIHSNNNINNLYIDKSNNQCNECSFRKDKNEIKNSFQYYFNRFIIFQNYSVQEIESVLYSKYRNPESRAVLHFFGDFGVGKSLSAKLISRVLFEKGSGLQGDGYFSINGEKYRIIDYDIQTTDSEQLQQKVQDLNQKVQYLRNRLYNTILNRLYRCPNSVIVLDEIQKVHPDIIKKVKTSLATYILTSDFEKEGATNRKSIEQIKEKASKLFKMVYNNNKFSNLITNSIPFLPLGKDFVNQAIEKQIINHFCGEKLIDALYISEKELVLSIIYQKMESLYSNENFRAIEKLTNELIFNKVSNFVMDYDRISLDFKNSILTNNDNNNNDNYKDRVKDFIFKLNNQKKIKFTLNIKPNQSKNNLEVEITPSLEE